VPGDDRGQDVDLVQADVGALQLLGEHPHEHRLGGAGHRDRPGVRHRLARGDPAEADVDAAPPLGERAEERPGDDEVAGQVVVDDPLPLTDFDLGQRRPFPPAAERGHHAVDRTHLGGDLLTKRDQGGEIVGTADERVQVGRAGRRSQAGQPLRRAGRHHHGRAMA